jgi:copper chaperone CopZ
MEKIQWKVEGMTCANCALSINKYLQQQGAKDVTVNPIDGDVSFEVQETDEVKKLAKGGTTATQTVFVHPPAALLVLPALYACVDDAYDSGGAHSLADESLGAIGTDPAGLCSRYEFLWPLRHQEPAQWRSQHECADHYWCRFSIHL